MQKMALSRWDDVRQALGYPRRDAQERLFAGAVEAVGRGEVVFASAPCGAGKSLIVVPMAAHVGYGGRVIHSSFTKAQQSQMTRDGQRLVELGVFSAVAEVRGRSEYVCLRRRRMNLEWAGEAITVAAPGMRADLERALGRPVSEQEWLTSRSDSDDGCGTTCGDWDYANVARERAREPGALVVVNHAVLALDAMLGGALVGYSEDDVLVLDEAHQAPDQFRSARGARITEARLRRLRRLAVSELAWDPGDEGISALNRALLGVRVDERQRYAFLTEALWSGGSVVPWARSILSAAKEREDEDGAKRVASVAQRLIGDLAAVQRACVDPDWVAWVELGESARRSVEVRPLDISEFAQGLLGMARAAVATSATVKGYPMAELGGGTLVEVGSPFDLASRRVGIITTNGRSGQLDDQRRILELTACVRRAKGGVLVLAPTNRMLVGGRWRSQADVCVEVLEADGHRVGRQNTPADVPDLVDGLRTRRYDVVVATASMREGIDVRGDGLAMVILFGLPWPYMGDPLLNARIAKVGDSRKWELLRPMMLTNLEQAIGRLIRDADDQGHVVLLDGRRSAVRDFMALVAPSTVKELR